MGSQAFVSSFKVILAANCSFKSGNAPGIDFKGLVRSILQVHAFGLTNVYTLVPVMFPL